MFREGSQAERYFLRLCSSLDIVLTNGDFIVDEEGDPFASTGAQRRDLTRLIRMGLIRKPDRSRGRITFTKKGALWALLYCAADHAPMLSWDERCLVVFDIPEAYRRLRADFRGMLRKVGFEQLQKSAWITRKDVYVRMREIILREGLEGWVSIFLVRKNGASLIGRSAKK